ncbi:LSU ribosomal protein L23P [Chthonomonas calidirosea]|uniref:Large ribosomal subunit protein uL23 n=1 Tax=Chthonomonas calidirosea (strain DSM 23976 / ICMP 18418 / T49) TaxID=1303518 RepID=S0EY60_CHTCT|nr:50S ribosomal protein L23 [Chthonomonas calidirosea]CCW36649.1 Ribosomal protein L23 [Chthonomonas calidirosea T49]CEK15598.1 LSU ribosomal protein L23P [Chthonomonas calidirosea]CEK16701.1 LSU ribosomal protein L23P [Chthonomonas calidirosea]
MRDPHEIIERPLLTEKTNAQAGLNKYHFRVRLDANKFEIAQAIQTIYAHQGVKVLSVNTMRVKGKKRRALVRGGKPGYSPTWKKAIVTTDRPLTLFEGV